MYTWSNNYKNMSAFNFKKLVGERLNELDCSDIPAAVRKQLETELSTAWRDEVMRLVPLIVTPKRITLAFAGHLGMRRRRNAAVPPPLPPRPAGAGL